MWGNPNQPEQEKGDRFSAEDAENRVLIVRPVEYIPDMPMRDTRGDAIKVNVVDLSDGGRLYSGALWFSGRLIKAFKGAVGTPFLGYISKERLPNGYRGWTFNDLAGNADWESVAQAWLEGNPSFLEPLPEPAPEPGSWHEQGPAPEWAGAVPARPSGPPVPPQRSGPPAPPVAPPAPPRPMSAPPAPSVSGPPAPPTESMLDRLRRQAEQPTSFTSNVGNVDLEPPY